MERLSTADPVATFEAHRRLLHGIAYRMLGSVADAEDVLQEARIRWLGAPHGDVGSPRSYLVTIVSRLCLDALGSARARRETYVGEWLPEPIATTPDSDPESVSMAFLVLLERLSPSERAAFLLADVFDYSFAEVAATLGKTEDACRQLATRARRHVKEARPAPRTVGRDAHARVLAAFVNACSTGDVVALARLLAADVVAHTDSGGRVRAARNAVAGADKVARLFVGLARKGTAGATLELRELNGLAALVLREQGTITTALALDLDGDGRIRAIFTVRNPDKLSRLDRPHAITPAG